MYEGKPLVLVIGSTDTGRTPIVAGLLRHTLGAAVVVATAGVLSHAGEHAAAEAQMALDQFGIDITTHTSRPLRDTPLRDADLLLAVDRGTEMVLFTELPNDPRIACLSMLAHAQDVLDPHRMPLGVWIAATRQLHEQVKAAQPAICQRIGIAPASTSQVVAEAPRAAHQPMIVSNGASKRWDNDTDMEHLLGLISSTSTNGSDQGMIAPAEHAPADHQSDLTQPMPATSDHAPTDGSSRSELVARMCHLVAMAEDAPEIIDWLRLRQALVLQLRATSGHAVDAQDFVSAATLMIEGKLMQHATLPHADALLVLRRALNRLSTTVDAASLGMIGTEIAQC